MMRARSDTLRLGWRDFGTEQAHICRLCGESAETLKHFLLECKELENTRKTCIKLQRPREEDEEKVMSAFLLFNKEDNSTEEYINVIEEMWKQRKNLMNQLQTNP